MKYVPFELDDPVDRQKLLNARVKRRKSAEGTPDSVIRAFVKSESFYVGVAIDDWCVPPEDLLEKWEFADGRPCGKEVTE